MSEQQKIWFITGLSRGLGQALAQAVLEAGDVVIGTTRDGSSDLSGSSDRLHLLCASRRRSDAATRADSPGAGGEKAPAAREVPSRSR